MDEVDPGMTFLLVSKTSRGLGKVDDVEGAEHSTLSSSLAEQLGIVERFERGIAGCRNRSMPELPECGSYGRWDVSVQEDPTWHLGLHRFRPRQRPP